MAPQKARVKQKKLIKAILVVVIQAWERIC